MLAWIDVGIVLRFALFIAASSVRLIPAIWVVTIVLRCEQLRLAR